MEDKKKEKWNGQGGEEDDRTGEGGHKKKGRERRERRGQVGGQTPLLGVIYARPCVDTGLAYVTRQA